MKVFLFALAILSSSVSFAEEIPMLPGAKLAVGNNVIFCSKSKCSFKVTRFGIAVLYTGDTITVDSIIISSSNLDVVIAKAKAMKDAGLCQ